MPEKVLIVEDDPTLLETLEYNLSRQGYLVLTAENGLDAVSLARKERPNLIVLDLMLPGLDGLEVCRVLRQELSMPILMLTARVDEIDKIIGLEMGADDYLTKPFSMRELLARVKAQLRRVRLTQAETEAQETNVEVPKPDRIVLDDLIIDLGRREVLRGDEVLHLKPKEFELLEFLVRHRGMVLTRSQILEQVWGWDYIGDTRTVDVHVRWLREKIEPEPASPVRIVTVRGVGYRFER